MCTHLTTAAAAMQAIVRRRRTLRAFRMLRRMAYAIRLVTRYVLNFRRRRRRWAALVMQKHARAALVHRLHICHYRTMLWLIDAMRAAYVRALTRTVNRRFAMWNLERKRREVTSPHGTATFSLARGPPPPPPCPHPRRPSSSPSTRRGAAPPSVAAGR